MCLRMAKKRKKKTTRRRETRIRRRHEAAAAESVVVSFRCAQETVDKLDAYAGQLQERFPGGKWKRGTAALNLVVLGLEQNLGLEG